METASINSENENRHEVVGKMIFATVPCLLSQSSEKFKTVNVEIIFDLAGVVHADSAGLARRSGPVAGVVSPGRDSKKENKICKSSRTIIKTYRSKRAEPHS